MEEKNATQEPMSNQQEQNSASAPEQEKKFTQADVDRIVKERLKRSDEAKEKAHSEELAAVQKSITQRENRLACREYLLENGYPAELLEIIDTNDPEEFKKKADRAYKLSGNDRAQQESPMFDTEIHSFSGQTSISDAFSRNQKHKPKKWPPYTSEE